MVYLGVMEKNNNAESTTQGVVTAQQVQDYLKKDLSVAIRCLDAIHSDPDLLAHLSQFMAGRINNARHKADPAQLKMEV